MYKRSRYLVCILLLYEPLAGVFLELRFSPVDPSPALIEEFRTHASAKVWLPSFEEDFYRDVGISVFQEIVYFMDPASYRLYMTIGNFLESSLDSATLEWGQWRCENGLHEGYVEYFSRLIFEKLWRCGFRRLTVGDAPLTLSAYGDFFGDHEPEAHQLIDLHDELKHKLAFWLQMFQHFLRMPDAAAGAGPGIKQSCLSILSRCLREPVWFDIHDRTEPNPNPIYMIESQMAVYLADEEIEFVLDTARRSGSSSPSGPSAVPSGASDRRSQSVHQDRQRTPERAVGSGDKITSVSGVSRARASSRRYGNEREFEMEEEGRDASGSYNPAEAEREVNRDEDREGGAPEIGKKRHAGVENTVEKEGGDAGGPKNPSVVSFDRAEVFPLCVHSKNIIEFSKPGTFTPEAFEYLATDLEGIIVRKNAWGKW